LQKSSTDESRHENKSDLVKHVVLFQCEPQRTEQDKLVVF